MWLRVGISGSARIPFRAVERVASCEGGSQTITPLDETRVNKPSAPRCHPDKSESKLAIDRRYVISGLAALGLTVLWAYWPTLGDLIELWSGQADYSHGFLVVPLAVWLLWLRRDRRPASLRPAVAWGLTCLALSLLVRMIGLRYSFDSLDGYSLILWGIGAVWLVGGWAYLAWALPSLLFLGFMVPLPFQFERLLSVPLQRVATALSCFLLQCLGQPAFAEGTTILLGPHQLFVEQACSGLRMFMGTLALAFAYLMATRRELWEQALLLSSVIPIALLANALRIVATGLMYQYLGDQVAQKFSHDLAGAFMIPLAAAMFAGVLWYLSRLVRPIDVVAMSELVGRERA
jgi:exosortase